MSQNVDLVNRDANGLNDHVKVAFDDVIAEPDGAHSLPCVWAGAWLIFTCTKGCCYNVMSIICGFPLALLWGCQFAYITFYHVWCIGPCMRSFMIDCGCYRKYFFTCVQCCLGPICETFGLCFSNIVVRNV
ncbi:caveolin-1-like [Littorina saxatilis]|uniref:Caveolin n=1 Tax=Littorina saxatilis TaxID=31220 RepID=A0AAN9ALZ5_9CAEN